VRRFADPGLTMPIHNHDMVAVFNEIADLLELQNANPFRVRAYRNAARRIGTLGEDVTSLITRNEDLRAIDGIVAHLAGKLREIASTGTGELLGQLRKASSPGVTALLDLPGIGPRRVQLLQELLHVHTLDHLREAAKAGRVTQLPGFGEKTEARMLVAIDARRTKSARTTLPVAAQHLHPLLDCLRATPGVEQALAAGSFRRRHDPVGDLDLAVAAFGSREVMRRFTGHKDVEETLASGTTRSSVLLRGGIQVDLRVVPPERFSAAPIYFTGSKARNIAIRRMAQNLGLEVNEYGVFVNAALPVRPRNRFTRRSGCRGFHRSCAKTVARSRLRTSARCLRW
jgi:DNA polymerase (family X)